MFFFFFFFLSVHFGIHSRVRFVAFLEESTPANISFHFDQPDESSSAQILLKNRDEINRKYSYSEQKWETRVFYQHLRCPPLRLLGTLHQIIRDLSPFFNYQSSPLVINPAKGNGLSPAGEELWRLEGFGLSHAEARWVKDQVKGQRRRICWSVFAGSDSEERRLMSLIHRSSDSSASDLKYLVFDNLKMRLSNRPSMSRNIPNTAKQNNKR